MEGVSTVPNGTDLELAAAIKELHRCEKKNLLINRIKLAIASACLLICVVLAVFVFRKSEALIKKTDTAMEVLTEAGNKINTLTDDLEKMDFDKLGKSLGNIVDVSEETIEEIHQAIGGLDQLVKDADDAMQHINSINFEDLNNGIQKLNDILEPVANFFKFFK